MGQRPTLGDLLIRASEPPPPTLGDVLRALSAQIQPVPSHVPTNLPPSPRIGGLSAKQRFEERVLPMSDTEPLAQTSLLNALLSHGTPKQSMAEHAEAIGNMTGELAPAAKTIGQAVQKGIKAYHGSPHDFEAFDLSKIGTGEGAQAYGHGLYFAEKEGTAKAYRDALSPMEVNVRGVPGVTWEHLTAGMRGVKKGSLDAAKASGRFTPAELDAMAFMSDADIDTTIRSMREQGAMDWRGAEAKKLWNRRADVLEQLKSETTIKPTGRMYEVQIHADPADFLDWDAPLSQQSEKVRQAADELFRPRLETRPIGNGLVDVRERGGGSIGTFPEERVPEVLANPSAHYPYKGEQLYREIDKAPKTFDMSNTDLDEAMAQIRAGRRGASETMRERGIPGIKYLDQGSRAAGEGTRNYVVFDDKLISIVKKYGILGALSAGLIDEAQAKQMQAQGLPQ